MQERAGGGGTRDWRMEESGIATLTAELFASGEEGHLRASPMDGGQTPRSLQL